MAEEPVGLVACPACGASLGGFITDLVERHPHHSRGILDGYQVFEGIFTAPRMLDVIEQLSSAPFDRTKGGARHLLRVPVVYQIAYNPLMLGLARMFVGRTATPFRATLFDKSRDANWLVTWHQDTALPLARRFESEDWGPWSTKAGVLHAHAPAWALEQVVALRLSLDDSSSTNGPLRVLPNTHLLGVVDRARIETLVRERKAVECIAPSGSVVAMRPLAVHASTRSTDPQPRRILHLEYASAVNLGPGIELAAV